MSRLFSRDHKVIAKQFLWYGLVLPAWSAGLLAMLIRWQSAHPGQRRSPCSGQLFWPPSGGVMPPHAYTSFFTMHGTIMIFFAITPILIGALRQLLHPAR